MGIFNMDSKFMRFMIKFADMMIINILVLICSIPVITIGPAITAGYYVALKEVRDEEGYIVKGFFKSFKANFKQGVIVTIIIGAVAAFIAYEVYTVYKWACMDNTPEYARLVFGAVVGLAILVMMTILYLFPLMARFYNTVPNYFKNSIMLGIKNFPASILMIIIVIFMLYMTVVNKTLILFTTGGAIYLNSLIMVKIFDKLMPKEEVEEDEYPDVEEEPQRVVITLENMGLSEADISGDKADKN
ncbi:MAG: YesL family protein [Lachnospiraceae bacterium]|nr:YesL family protein [Lachnospiraceae bacterium]